MGALILDAVRSPIGKRNGTLASVRADELAAQVLDALVRRHDLDPAEIEDVQMGCVTQIGEQGLNVGRIASLVAGWPETVCATTVDRQCGSSLQAAFNASTAITAGELNLVVAAGVESMSRVPMGSNLGADGFAGFSEKLFERWEIVPQGISAEVIAEEWGLSREELDAFSLESHRRALAAVDEGRFEHEVVPIEVSNPHAGVLFAVDETPRRDTSAEKLAALAPAFKPDGVVTAGNSSQIVDGAAAVLVTSEAAASRRSSSFRSVAVMRAPVAPSGCPSEMPPPFGFTSPASQRSCSPVSASVCKTTDANASLISITAMSSQPSPAFSSARPADCGLPCSIR